MLTSLSHKDILSLSGPDVRSFLQGLITQNVDLITPDSAIYSALLSPQGKMVADFFAISKNTGETEQIFLVLDSETLEDVQKRLNMYKLRADVIIRHETDLGVGVTIGHTPSSPGDWICFADPRLTQPDQSGTKASESAPLWPPLWPSIWPPLWHVIATKDSLGIYAIGSPADYDSMRFRLGLTDGCRDWIVNKTLLLELWADKLNGIDFNKGCYVGQEVTARTHYRKAIKKRLMKVSALLPTALPSHSPIMCGDMEVGTTLSTSGPSGLALIRIAQWEEQLDLDHPVLVGDVPVVIQFPEYATPTHATPAGTASE